MHIIVVMLEKSCPLLSLWNIICVYIWKCRHAEMHQIWHNWWRIPFVLVMRKCECQKYAWESLFLFILLVYSLIHPCYTISYYCLQNTLKTKYEWTYETLMWFFTLYHLQSIHCFSADGTVLSGACRPVGGFGPEGGPVLCGLQLFGYCAVDQRWTCLRHRRRPLGSVI